MGKSFCPVWGDEEDEKTISTQGAALGSVIADLSGRNTSPRHRYRHRHRHLPRHRPRPRHRHSQKNPQQNINLAGDSPMSRIFPCQSGRKGELPFVLKDKPVFLLGSGILAISLCFLLE